MLLMLRLQQTYMFLGVSKKYLPASQFLKSSCSHKCHIYSNK